MSEQKQNIDFSVDSGNLYREENFTDIKVASIRKLTPINADGTDDKNRETVYLGQTQLMSPEGPVPLQSYLKADSLEGAMAAFPAAMQQAMSEMIEKFEKMRQQQQQQQQQQQANDSRIIVPGR